MRLAAPADTLAHRSYEGRAGESGPCRESGSHCCGLYVAESAPPCVPVNMHMPGAVLVTVSQRAVLHVCGRAERCGQWDVRCEGCMCSGHGGCRSSRGTCVVSVHAKTEGQQMRACVRRARKRATRQGCAGAHAAQRSRDLAGRGTPRRALPHVQQRGLATDMTGGAGAATQHCVGCSCWPQQRHVCPDLRAADCAGGVSIVMFARDS